MAISKEALAALIVAQTGNEDFTADMLDDDMLAGLIIDDEEETEVVEDTEDEDEEEDEDGEEEEEGQEEEEEDLLANVDVDKLTPTERIFYDYVVSEKEKAKKREISLTITSSQLSAQHKLLLSDMAKEGVSLKAIEKAIKTFEQIEASSARIGGTSKIISKSKIKKTAASQKKTQAPKMGTREFGQYLANLKKGKK